MECAGVPDQDQAQHVHVLDRDAVKGVHLNVLLLPSELTGRQLAIQNFAS